MEKVEKSEQEWRQDLTPEQYRVLREAGTERAVHRQVRGRQGRRDVPLRRVRPGALRLGDEVRVALGWPSFTDPADREHVELIEDRSHGMVRTEVRCARCGSHLGHVFHDGPGETGERYCINSAALDLETR